MTAQISQTTLLAIVLAPLAGSLVAGLAGRRIGRANSHRVTILGVLVGLTVTSAIVVETVFSRNGIGKLAQESVLVQDVPVVLAIVTLAATVFVVVNLIVDLLYPLLDPRITQHRRKPARRSASALVPERLRS